MTKRTAFLLLLSATLATAPAQTQAEKKSIALTFDDLPGLGPLGFWRPREVSNMILRSLEQRGIVATGFVVEEKIDEDPSSYVVLEDWGARGHTLGNQTYSDVDLNQLGPEDFLQHVADGQRSLRRLSRVYPIDGHYFRYPYLHQGPTEKTRKRIARVLERAEYKLAPVTVKTSDYRFNVLFVELQRESPERLDRLKEVYLQHLRESLDYAEQQSQRVFSRNIPHILWLRCGIATAHFLEDLLQLLEQRGYQFVSLPTALDDPAYGEEEQYIGPAALSHIDRVAATRGLPFDATQGEMTTSEIEKLLEH